MDLELAINPSRAGEMRDGLLAGGGSSSVQASGDTAGEATPGSSDESSEDPPAAHDPGFAETMLSSLLGVIMGTVGGVTAGATIMWPPDTDGNVVPPEYRTYGLILCLLSGVITNVVYMIAHLLQLRGSNMPCAVGGTNYPAIIFAQKQISTMFEADEPNNVLVAYMIIAVASGLLTALAAQFRLLRPVVSSVPFPVMLGFLTSIGVGLLFKAVAITGPKAVLPCGAWMGDADCGDTFDALVDRADIVVPGVGSAVVVFALQNAFQPCGADCLPPARGNLSRLIKFLVPLVAMIMFVGVNVIVPAGDPNGLLLNTTQTDVFALVGGLSRKCCHSLVFPTKVAKQQISAQHGTRRSILAAAKKEFSGEPSPPNGLPSSWPSCARLSSAASSGLWRTSSSF